MGSLKYNGLCVGDVGSFGCSFARSLMVGRRRRRWAVGHSPQHTSTSGREGKGTFVRNPTLRRVMAIYETYSYVPMEWNGVCYVCT